jgi:hypothetical protein
VGADDVSEIKRLEQLIHQNIGVTRGLSDKVQKLSYNIKLKEKVRNAA